MELKEILSQMSAHSKLRETELQNYLVHRVYKVNNHRFNKYSEMEVTMKFVSPSKKEFDVLWTRGSDFLRKKVFDQLLKAEREAVGVEKKRSDITEDNYYFGLIGREEVNSYPCYVLSITPKRPDKYLLEGTIWVETNDFAIVKIEGSPIKKPSVWTRKINFVRNYEKIQDFWLPSKDETVTDIVVFGRSVLTINYNGYHVNFKSEREARSLQSSELKVGN